MVKGNSFDPVVLLFLFGLYFVIDFFTAKDMFGLLYGLILIFYYFKCRIIEKKSM